MSGFRVRRTLVPRLALVRGTADAYAPMRPVCRPASAAAGYCSCATTLPPLCCRLSLPLLRTHSTPSLLPSSISTELGFKILKLLLSDLKEKFCCVHDCYINWKIVAIDTALTIDNPPSVYLDSPGFLILSQFICQLSLRCFSLLILNG